MEKTANHYYGIVYKLSLVTGMCPQLETRKRLFRTFLLTVALLSLVIPQIAFQCKCEGDIHCTLMATTGYLLSFVVAVKVYTFQFNVDKLRTLTEHLYVDWETVESLEEYEIMKSHAENSRLFSIIYPIYCISAMWLFTSISFIPLILDIVLPLNESRPMLLPQPGYYFVDERKYFIYIFIHAVLALKVIFIGLATHDCMFVSYVEHICSMFAVVGSRFKYLSYEHNNMTNSIDATSDEKYQERFAYLVRTHHETLKLAQLLENTFTKPLGLQLIVATIGVSITLQQITVEASLLKAIRYFFYVVGQLIHLFCFNLEGQKLLDHSIQICDEIYSSSWYKLPIKVRKLLMLVMMKTLRPTCFSAAKIYVFSLENFATVLQTSMSYFTVLASF